MAKGRAAAVIAKCVECCAGSRSEASKCRIYDCPIWPWGVAAKSKRRAEKRAKNAQNAASEHRGG
jgi:hypothetical protein